MRHKAHVLIAVILVLVYTAAVTAQSTEIEQLRLEAEQGNANAQCNLGEMYHRGKVVAQNYQEAMKWYRLAIEQGNARAQYNLGVMYSKGEGVPQDYEEAVKWYRLAAEQGDERAQTNLGLMYSKGEGVPQDYVQTHKWLNLAVSRATPGESKNFRLTRDKLAESMTASQVAEAQRLAREWQPKTWEQLKGE